MCIYGSQLYLNNIVTPKEAFVFIPEKYKVCMDILQFVYPLSCSLTFEWLLVLAITDNML